MSDVRLTALNPADSSPVPVACDAAGKLLLQDVPPPFDGNLSGDLTVTGSGTFGGGSSVAGGSEIKDGDGQAAFVVNDGYGKGTLAGSAFVLQNTSGTNTVLFDTASGAATFEGHALIGGSSLPFNVNGAYIRCNSAFTNQAAAVAGRNFASGGANWVGANAALGLTTSYITEDGEAVFAGGNAGFTKEGYLFCTTVQGQKVVLDSVSNGAGSWTAYSTRRDKLSEKVDQIRDTNISPSQDLPET